MDTENFLKSSLFNTLKTNINRCWEPSENCTVKSIKAHSIQNSKVLDLLCLDGQLIMPQEEFKKGGEIHQADFSEVGHKKASTFTGLCGKHDNEIFAPIDDFEISLNNDKQLFLLVYRSVLKKFHSLSLAAVSTQKIYNDQVKVGRATKNRSDPSLKFSSYQWVKAYGAYLYKRILDEAYLAETYQTLHHDTFSFKHRRPTIAVSAFYWLVIQKPQTFQVPWISLNVFPTYNETHVVFSYLTEDAPYTKKELENFFNSSDKRRS